jgi:integrase/recombinase XerD
MDNKMTKIIEQMDESIQRYIYSLTKQSKRTIDTYTMDLKLFDDYVKSKKLDILTLTLEDLQGYSRFLRFDKKYAESTMDRKLQVVKYLYKYLTETIEVLQVNPAKKLELPEIPERLPKYLTLKEAQRLIKVIDKEKNDFLRTRDKAIMMIFLNNGLRVSELADLNLDNIRGNKLIFKGKNNRERPAKLNNDTLTVLKEYLKIRPEVSHNHLFLSTHKKPISVGAVQYTVYKYLDIAGLKGYSTHKLRHSAAVIMLEQGVGIRTIQQLYGHKDVKTTEIYANVTGKLMDEASDKMDGLFTD